MNKLTRIMLFVVALGGFGNTQAAVECKPFSIPVAETITECGAGLTGSKYKTTSKQCPSGLIVLSTEYDTSECRSIPAAPNAVNTVSKCVVTPDACAALPNVMACPTGMHWTLAGSGVAHCVQDDPTCPWGTSLTHDVLGNPSCKANTCPSNQVLAGNGISCVCPAALSVWNGASCTAPVVTCVANSTAEAPLACGPGYLGTQFRSLVTSCPSGPYGAPLTTFTAYDTSGCTPLPVTCTPGSVALAPEACGLGYTGTMFKTATTICPTGSYGAPSVSTSGYDTSGCGCANGASDYPTCTAPPPPCTPTSTTTSASCGTGFTGTKFTTTTYLCPSGTDTSTNTSGCGCANGAADYPTCTPLAPPKPPFTCPVGTKSSWTSGTKTFCWIGSEVLEVGHSLMTICNTGSAVFLEVERYDTGTDQSDIGYACNDGATTIYTIFGEEIQ